MRWLALSIVTLLAVSTLPTGIAGEQNHHWNGYVLDRKSIPNHVMVNQDYDYYSLHTGDHDVVVVAFIFTTCPDVCPLITNNLIQAEKQLEDVDYQFISITVDPATDSPAVLKAYMEDYDITWPHLTAGQDIIEQVWGDFGISVITEEIENHDHDHSHGSDDHESSVMVVMPDGGMMSHEVEPTGWDQLTAIAHSEEWVINSSYGSFGNFVSGINNDEAPADYSWWWDLHIWNMTANSWESAPVGIDSIDAGILAFAPNSTDDSAITAPDMTNDTEFYIVQSDGSTISGVIDEVNAWHMTLAALESFDAPDSEYGHYMSSINDVSAPSDYSWSWQLHYWNETSESWIESQLGMDSLYEKEHIAWAPNSTADETIPSPGSEMVHKLGVVYPNGDAAIYDGQYFAMGTDVSAMEHTSHTFGQNGVEFETTDEDVSSIAGIDGDYNLYIWHNMGEYSHWMSTSDSANESILMEDANHYAWVADGQDVSSLGDPEQVDEEEETETSTSHSTQTFILNGDWEPKVVFLGYDWDVDLFVEDVKRAAGTTDDPDDHEDSIPGFTFVTVASGIGLAIIAASRDE